MIFQVLKNSFSRWWDKLFQAILTSLISSINPFFILSIFILFEIGFGKVNPFENIQNLLFPSIIFSISNLFPLTFAGIALQKKISENESIYLRDYFKDYFKSLKETFLDSIFLLIIYSILIFLLIFSLIFYVNIFKNLALIKYIIIIFILWCYIILHVIQFILIPIFIYNSENKFLDKIKLSLKIIFLEFFNILFIYLVDSLLFFILTLTKGFSIITYYGLSANIRIYTYKYIIEKYQKKEEKENENDENIYEAWNVLMRKK